MIAFIRKRLTWANVAMTLALVFATTGGAYAAKKYLITSTAQIKPSVLKQLKGSAGAKGEAGERGSIGPQGPIGPAGPNGKNGESGTAGEKGLPGEGVVSHSFAGTQEPTSKPCNALGGSEFQVAGATSYACNGKIGKDGKSVAVGIATSGSTGECEEGGATVEVEGEASTKQHVCNGSPWTAGGTLPSGKTEKGTWGTVIGKKVLFGGAYAIGIAPISFAIPLAAPLSAVFPCGGGASGEPACQIHYIKPNGNEVIFGSFEEATGERSSSGCPGTVANPAASNGNLCVYINEDQTSFLTLGFRPSSGGVVLSYLSTAEGFDAYGTWAVTAG